jgi:hypothetical protein
MRRKEAEGSIYTGKCQGTRGWSSLPHHNINLVSINLVLGLVVKILE